MVIIRIAKKFSYILSKHQKVRIIELLVLMIIGGIMEMLSVSMMIPFMQVMISQDDALQNTIVAWIYNVMGLHSHQSFMIWLAVFLMALYVVKNAFLVFQVTTQEKFVQNNQFALQKRLYLNYVSRPYEFFLTSNTGEIIQIIMTDTTLAFSALTTLISFASEMIVGLMLVITAFVVAPYIMIIMASLILVAVLLLLLFSNKLVRKAGEEYQLASTNLYQTLLQSLEGIKIIKLTQKTKYFFERYERYGKYFVHASYIHKIGSFLPRYFLETVAMCGIFATLVGQLIYGVSVEALIPAVSGVAMASVRLLPCANRIAAAVSTLSYSEPAVDKLISNIYDLNLDDAGSIEELSNVSFRNKELISKMDSAVNIVGLTYRYPTGERNIFENVTFDILKGQSIGIVGPSGAGKTTVVDIILGLLRPQKGKILVDGVDIYNDMDGWLSQIGYIPQSLFMIDGSIRENVAFGLEDNEIDDNKVWKALEEASLADFVRSLQDGINAQIGERGVRISGGQRQRIGIARALYNDPEVLFFDEATSALDNDTEATIMDSINHLHGTKTMIIIAHRLTTIEKCDVVYRVENGTVVRER